MSLNLPDQRRLSLGRPLIVGILNVTPDSFTDGGAFIDVQQAVQHACRMAKEGADVIDIGGESTRPGAGRVPAEQQIERLLPVIKALQNEIDTPLSVDTTRAAVAEAALDAGVSILNDISAGRDDPQMFALAATRRTPLILMHMQGQPADMQNAPHYDDVVAEVVAFLLQRAALAMDAGVPQQQIIIDPGIGFGKSHEQNLKLLSACNTFVATGYAVMIGTSRKRFLGELVGEPNTAQRDVATAATTALAVSQGVQMIRVHNVALNRQAADVAAAVKSPCKTHGI